MLPIRRVAINASRALRNSQIGSISQANFHSTSYVRCPIPETSDTADKMSSSKTGGLGMNEPGKPAKTKTPGRSPQAPAPATPSDSTGASIPSSGNASTPVTSARSEIPSTDSNPSSANLSSPMSGTPNKETAEMLKAHGPGQHAMPSKRATWTSADSDSTVGIQGLRSRPAAETESPSVASEFAGSVKSTFDSAIKKVKAAATAVKDTVMDTEKSVAEGVRSNAEAAATSVSNAAEKVSKKVTDTKKNVSDKASAVGERVGQRMERMADNMARSADEMAKRDNEADFPHQGYTAVKPGDVITPKPVTETVKAEQTVVGKPVGF